MYLWPKDMGVASIESFCTIYREGLSKYLATKVKHADRPIPVDELALLAEDYSNAIARFLVEQMWKEMGSNDLSEL